MLFKNFLRLILITLLFASCSDTIDTKLLLGSWKMRDIIPQPGMDTNDSLTFFANDSFYTSLYADRKIAYRICGKYKLDEKEKSLTLIFITGTSYDLISGEPKDFLKDMKNQEQHFQIFKLNASLLELLNLETKKRERYVRY